MTERKTFNPEARRENLANLSMRELKERQDEYAMRTLLLSREQEINFYNPSDLDPVKEEVEITEQPPVLAALLSQQQIKMEKAWTLEKTFEDPNWRKEITAFLLEYMENPEGQSLLEDLNIQEIRELRPSQAITLATVITQTLMKYDYVSLKAGSPRERRADEMSVLEILRDGVESKDDDSWEGNGVCRNFAATEFGLFEGLKDLQKEGSVTKTMKALVVWGTEHANKKVERAMLREDDGTDTTHAWNAYFLVPKKGEVHISISDSTWAKLSRTDGKIVLQENDYTFERMEGLVYSLSQAIAEVEPESWSAVAGFYKSMLEKYKERAALPAQHKRDYYIWRYLQARKIHRDDEREGGGLPGDEELTKKIKEVYLAAFEDSQTEISRPLGTQLRVLAHQTGDDDFMTQLIKYGRSLMDK